MNYLLVLHNDSDYRPQYFRDPEATRRAFRGGYFNSGDLAVMYPDGYISILDRSKDIIISGGEVRRSQRHWTLCKVLRACHQNASSLAIEQGQFPFCLRNVPKLTVDQ